MNVLGFLFFIIIPLRCAEEIQIKSYPDSSSGVGGPKKYPTLIFTPYLLITTKYYKRGWLCQHAFAANDVTKKFRVLELIESAHLNANDIKIYWCSWNSSWDASNCRLSFLPFAGFPSRLLMGHGDLFKKTSWFQKKNKARRILSTRTEICQNDIGDGVVF